MRCGHRLPNSLSQGIWQGVFAGRGSIGRSRRGLPWPLQRLAVNSLRRRGREFVDPAQGNISSRAGNDRARQGVDGRAANRCRFSPFQYASWILTSFFIVLFVKPDATDRQLSRIFFINVYDGHLGAAGFAANNITDLHVVFIRHRFLQSSPMREAFRL